MFDLNVIEIEKHESRERALKAAKKHKEYEDRKRKEGWQYVNITPQIQIFIPCDKKGEPTEEGHEMIARAKSAYKIK